MARIPQQFIDELLARADIVEIINTRLPLKRAGHEFKACCPFHDEKTPSFYVSPQKQFYHCFGCGAHGTALGFLIEHDRLDFIEAVESLASQLGMEVPRESGSSTSSEQRSQQDGLYRCLQDAAHWYQQQLRHYPNAIEYLKNRGLDGKIAAHFGLGYAPAAWDKLLKSLKPQHGLQSLVNSDLVVTRGNRHYDRFRERIMFPIRDGRGRITGFGGRVIGDAVPKYLNSSETSVFHKGQALYGLYEARQSGNSLEEILIVEGYMDVIGLAQHGIPNAVATLGTATTREHIQRLYRTAKRLVFCFDGDQAGRSAAWRALELTLSVMEDGREANFLFLPEGQDPDSYVRLHGPDSFLKLAGQSISLSRLLLQELRRRYSRKDMEARAGLASEGMALLRNLRAGILRSQIVASLARETGLDPSQLENNGQGNQQQTIPKPPHLPKRAKQQQSRRMRWSPLRTVIALLVEHPALAKLAPDPASLGDHNNPGISLYAEILETLRSNPNITTAGILERWQDREEEIHLLRLIASRDVYLDFPAAQREFQDAITRLLYQRNEARFEMLRLKAQTDGLSSQEKAEFSQLALRDKRNS